MAKLFGIKHDYANAKTEYNILGIKIKLVNKKILNKPDYTFALNKIKEKYAQNKKIRVGFFVSENSKWNAEILYKELENNNYFEPVVVISAYTTLHQNKDLTKTSVQANYDFFKEQGKRVIKAYDEEQHKYIPLKELDIDILFYQQPWGIDDTQHIDVASKDMICCSYTYGLTILKGDFEVRPFHEKLFYYFVANEQTKAILKEKEIKCLDNLNIVGYPKLDIYNGLKKIPSEKKTIIYAPHHSYRRGYRVGTFDFTGEQILNFAKAHPEYNWVFKPHPDLKEVLYKDKKYGAEFTKKYYEEWDKIGTRYEKGNYFDLFMASDLLITDCISFLLEYIPSGNPLIRLERFHYENMSNLGKDILKGLYRVKSFKAFEKTFNQLLTENNDYLKETRKSITKNVVGESYCASKNIVNELEKLFIK